MAIVYEKSKLLTDNEMHYCPGCTHGIVHKLIAEVLTELDLVDKAVGICPVGCAVFAFNYFNIDMQQASHGRAPAVASGIRRVLPDSAIFTYQGDGDLASIGAAEIVHAAMRGEKFTTIFINNAIYGMTGGQMSPTTLVGQKASTAPLGRDQANSGSPLRVVEMLSTIEGVAYAERTTIVDIPSLNKTKKAIKKAFQMQMAGEGFTIVEILSTCSTNWGKTPLESIEWLKSDMIPQFPLGVFKDKSAEVK